jgi:hypothetical protein
VKYIGISKSIAEGQLYSEIKAADISIIQKSILGKSPHIKISIEDTGGGSKVTVTNDFKTWDEFAKSIKSWVQDESELCR